MVLGWVGLWPQVMGAPGLDVLDTDVGCLPLRAHISCHPAEVGTGPWTDLFLLSHLTPHF